MSRRGFALLAVLWLVAALTVLGGVAVGVARTGSQTTRNRILLTRAGWAREACVEILLARYAQDPGVRHLDAVDLGRGTWCEASVDDPGTKVNVNVAGRDALATVIAAASHRRAAVVDSLVDALLDWRDADTIPRPLGFESATNRNGPLADVRELRYVRGFDDSLVARLSALITTRGGGAINVNAGPPAVLATLPGIGNEAIEILMARRTSQPIPNADMLAGLLSSGARATLLASYPEFVRAAVFTPPQLVAMVTGGVRGTPITARVILTVVPVSSRLAVIRRETE